VDRYSHCNPDPFTARVSISSNITFRAWRAARFSLAQIGNPLFAGPGADPDNDGVRNALEYAFGLDPWVNDKPVFSFGIAGGSGGVFRANYQRIRLASDLTFAWSGSTNLVDWTAAAVSESVATDTNLRFEDVTANFGSQHPGAQFYRLGVTLDRFKP